MTHLPILIDHQLVEFDYDEGVLRATPELEALVESSDTASNQQRRWFRYYAIPAAALAAVVLALDFGLLRTSLSTGIGVTLVGVLLLLSLPLLKYGDGFLSRT